MSKQTEKGEDERLIGDFLIGNKSSFDRLVLRYQNRVVNLCFRMTGDYEEAVDCAQEIFVKVFRSLDHFRFQSSFSTWLYRITVNTCKNRLSSFKYRFHRKMIRLDEIPRTDGDCRTGRNSPNPGQREIVNGSASPADVLERRENEALLQKAIDSLPKTHKAALVLRDIEGLSYEEIGSILGCGLGTVKSRIARARDQLRHTLEGMM